MKYKFSDSKKVAKEKQDKAKIPSKINYNCGIRSANMQVRNKVLTIKQIREKNSHRYWMVDMKSSVSPHQYALEYG